MMDIEIRNGQRKVHVDRRRLRRLAGTALGELGLGEAQLSVLIVSDRRMRELNRAWRGLDRPTDVLSFSQREGESPRSAGLVLGDIVISAETASRQAPRYGHSTEEEMDRLLVHGILHLAGFDHEKGAKEKRRMESWKRKILKALQG